MPSKACLFEALIATKVMQMKFKEQLSDYISDQQKYCIAGQNTTQFYHYGFFGKHYAVISPR